jgi:prepilin-type N-terminal cleavage/methylation domain-containing protein
MISRRRAFTLIELLVVIAIIAILAAILFPVFAQAKEAAKKTTTLSNFKQTATAFVLYAGDYDDLLPLAYSPDEAANAVRWNFVISIPNGWRPDSPWCCEPRKSQDGLHWSNSIQPYSKNYDMYEASGHKEFQRAGTPYSTAVFPYKDASLSFNGLLHSWSMTAVAQPSRLTLVWQGVGNVQYQGLTISNPALRCDGTGPCRFNATGVPQPGSTTTSGSGWFWVTGAVGDQNRASAWSYNQGSHFVYSDTSAKFVNIGGVNDSTTYTRSVYHPWARFAANHPGGVPLSQWVCTSAGSTVSYACFFRPDSEFDYF